MRTLSSRLRVIAAMLALGLGAAACGSGSGSGSAGGGDIQLGTVDALTGAYATLGAEVKDGVQAAVDSVNSSGGLLGRKVVLTSLDSQSSPTKAQQQMTELVSRQHVVGILGPEDTSALNATVPAASRLGIPNVVVAAAWPNGLPPDQTDWTWTGTANTEDGIDRYISYFEQNNIKRVAIIGNGTLFSQQLPNYLKSKGSLPFEIVSTEQFTSGAVDVSPQLLRAASANPDFVLSWMSGTDQVNVIKTYKRLSLPAPLGVNGGNTGTAIRKAVGDADLEGVFALTYPAQMLDKLPESFPNRKAAQAYLDGMKAAGLNADNGASNASLGWDSAMSLMEAIKAANSTDPQAIQKAMNEQTYVGANASFVRTPTDHSGAKPGSYVLVRSQGNAWTYTLAVTP